MWLALAAAASTLFPECPGSTPKGADHHTATPVSACGGIFPARDIPIFAEYGPHTYRSGHQFQDLPDDRWKPCKDHITMEGSDLLNKYQCKVEFANTSYYGEREGGTGYILIICQHPVPSDVLSLINH
jgi:hypothetical protein